MRVASLPRFLPGQFVARAAAFALLLAIVVIVLLCFGALDVAAAESSQSFDPGHPFRW